MVPHREATNLRVGDLCKTVRTHPANRNLLVTIVEIDPSMAPNSVKIRRITGDPFPSVLPGGAGCKGAIEVWCSRAKLRRVELDDENAEEVLGYNLPSHYAAEERREFFDRLLFLLRNPEANPLLAEFRLGRLSSWNM